jgi:hypothetical protein
MALQDLANVVLSVQGPALTQVGFGTVACAAYHTHNADLNRTYTNLADMTTDGFLAYEPAYIMVQRAFQQSPRPDKVKLLRLQTPWSEVIQFSVGTLLNSTVYSFVASYKGVDYTVSFTSDGTATVAEICAGLNAAFTALPAAISTHATASGGVTFSQIATTTPGDMIYYSAWTDNLKFVNNTTDPGIATDLGVIRNADTDWYGLSVDMNSKAIIVAADGWAETQDMLCGFDNCDSIDFDNTVTTDVGNTLKLASAARCLVGFPSKDTRNYMGVAMLAERFPHDPGSVGAGGTFFGKTLVGVTPGAWTATQITNLRAKNYVTYVTTAGRQHTFDGKTPSGEFGDQVRGLDWYRIRSEERIAQLLLNNDKVPFTDRGISQVYSELVAQQLDGEAVELFVPGTSTMTAPLRASTNPTDRANRVLKGFVGSVTLAGAIQLVSPISVSVGF